MSDEFEKMLAGLEGGTIPGDILRSLSYHLRPRDVNCSETRCFIGAGGAASVVLHAGVYAVQLNVFGNAGVTAPPMTTESVLIIQDVKGSTLSYGADQNNPGWQIKNGQEKLMFVPRPNQKIGIISNAADLLVSGIVVFTRLSDGSTKRL